MIKRTLTALAALAVASFGLAACGGSDEETSTSSAAGETTTSSSAAGGGGGGETISFEAAPAGLAYTTTEVTAKAGADTIDFVNPSSTAHNVVIEGADGNDIAETDTISSDETTTTADLEPGTYTFYCSVDSHREAGMEGTLTVK